MPIDVLLLAAGFGTRLRPLTDEIPKALLPLYGTPFLDLHIDRLIASPVAGLATGYIVVNGHHRADVLRDHLARHPRRERLAFSLEPQILGTGGAIRPAAGWLRSDPFLLLNSDALFPLPGPAALEHHRRGGFAATLVLARSPVHPNVLIEQGRVTAILRDRTDPSGLTYTGCCLLARAFIDLLPDAGFHDLRDTWDTLRAQGRLGAWVMPDDPPLVDVGTPERYLAAHRLCAPETAGRYGLRLPLAQVVLAEGSGFIAPDAIVGAGAAVRDSVVLAGAHLAPGVTVRGSIVGPGAVVEESVTDRLITTRGWVPVGPAPGA